MMKEGGERDRDRETQGDGETRRYREMESQRILPFRAVASNLIGTRDRCSYGSLMPNNLRWS